MCSLKNVFIEKNNKVGKTLEKKLKEFIFDKVAGFKSANFRKVSSFTDILQEFC